MLILLPMDRWLERVDENVRGRKLFRDGQTILVAVSGGVDSMVLLYALHALAGKHQWKLAVAHFNHQLRGRSSDADEKLVRKTAAQLNLPMFVGSHDVKTFAKEHGLSIEMAARQLRHEFFAKTAKEMKTSCVALAHHADDQVELFFLRLLRGAGGEGLKGMTWGSRSPSDINLHLMRPLLNFTKEELLFIAKAQGVRFREDATNAQTDFLRNRIRHDLIPLLSQIKPAAKETILRTMEIVGAESELSLEAAVRWLATKKRPPFAKLPVAIQRLSLQLQIRGLGFGANFDLIEHLRLAPGQAISVTPDFALERTASGTVQTQEKRPVGFSVDCQKIDLATQKSIRFADSDIHWTFRAETGQVFAPEGGCEIFDADKVGRNVTLRHWRAGDRFQPIGMKSPAKLQDIFINQKIPRAQRHRLIVAESERGEIFWVEGLRMAESFKLTPSTRRRLKWCFG
ncbi:MAG: tRNA(Ile)-lysidine synthase [Verrucomicrobiales bacterium]|nr:tRNA(Ile)-lysidine synthase [Verrucomicrobiales bacterium]